MSKRTRGSQRTTQRRASARPGEPVRTRAAVPPQRQLEAAATIAEEVVEERPAAAAEELRAVSRSTHARARAKPGSVLAAKAATEYVYVAQDLRRIALVAVLLFGIMFAIWALRLLLP